MLAATSSTTNSPTAPRKSRHSPLLPRRRPRRTILDSTEDQILPSSATNSATSSLWTPNPLHPRLQWRAAMPVFRRPSRTLQRIEPCAPGSPAGLAGNASTASESRLRSLGSEAAGKISRDGHVVLRLAESPPPLPNHYRVMSPCFSVAQN